MSECPPALNCSAGVTACLRSVGDSAAELARCAHAVLQTRAPYTPASRALSGNLNYSVFIICICTVYCMTLHVVKTPDITIYKKYIVKWYLNFYNITSKS